MSLRCLLFSSDEEAVKSLCRVLADLGIEAEVCSALAAAAEKAAQHAFQVVVLDWDNQPEASTLLAKARERKANERPLTLAVVSHDLNVPQALQAGANSVLRKPIVDSQARDTLATARDLLRAKHDPGSAQRLSGIPPVQGATGLPPAAKSEKTLRAGEFLQSAPTSPGTQFVTDSDVDKSQERLAGAAIDPLKDLEPMAASVDSTEPPAAPVSPAPEEARGLSWYMTSRAAKQAANPEQPSATAAAKPELLSYDQAVCIDGTGSAPAAEPKRAEQGKAGDSRDQATEQALFAYISGETPEKGAAASSASHGRFRTLAVAAIVLMTCGAGYWTLTATAVGPRLRSAVGHAALAARNWLNPQPVTAPQVPVSHENFARAGDEFKLPVAENIPDATTDPSQVHVIPVVDPTSKQNKPADATQAATPTVVAPVSAADQGNDGNSQPAAATAPPSAAPDPFVRPQPAPAAIQVKPKSDPVRVSTPHYVPASTPEAIPSSLKSQMASATPEASGNKPPEYALPSIEPVEIPEVAARGQLLDQQGPDYPVSAKGQKGTVVLQVLIGRDGSVQDAKFLQGSLMFARAAIDGVRQWHFKPYTMNGRPVSVLTQLTMTFKPAS